MCENKRWPAVLGDTPDEIAESLRKGVSFPMAVERLTMRLCKSNWKSPQKDSREIHILVGPCIVADSSGKIRSFKNKKAAKNFVRNHSLWKHGMVRYVVPPIVQLKRLRVNA